MNFKHTLTALMALGSVALAAPVFANPSFTIDDVTVREGDPQVSVDWNMGAAPGLLAIGIDITFDTDLFMPVTADGSNVLPGCIVNDGGASLQSCRLIFGDTTVRIVLTCLGCELQDASGTIVFNVDPAAVEGDSTVLGLNNFDIVPVDFTTDLTEGSITVIGSDAVLTLDPDVFDFGTQDILAPAQTADFTIGNAGNDDSLTVSTVSVGGAPFSVTGNCNGEEIAPGGTCVVTVTFDPTTAGSFADILQVSTDVGTATSNLSGAATATANVVINPPFGPVDLGVGLQGETLTANGSVQNTGSADATASCDLVGDDVFSTSLPLNTPITIAAGAAAIPFTVSCALPANAADGDTFNGEIQCSIDGAPVNDTTHFLTCGVSEFEPLPVPTMQNWALILFALMMLLVGGISIRMFRA